MFKQILNKAKHKWIIACQYNFARKILPFFKGKDGIEIGGPSSIFLFELPVYSVVKNLDGCNFSNSTLWEGKLKEGNNYKFFKNKPGYQFIAEGSDLAQVESGRYDFVLGSHCLEHFANPIKALKEWLRVLKPGGIILLVLPKKEATFDHNRSVTSFDHLKKDFENGMDETDLTHLDEILNLHDLSLDPGAGGLENFKQRSLQNFQYRCLHHHVFDLALLDKIFSYLNIEKVANRFIPQCHQVIIGLKR